MRRIVPILLALLAACASAAAGQRPTVRGGSKGAAGMLEPVVDRQSVDYTLATSADRVLQALPGVYEQLGITGAGLLEADPAQRLFGRRHIRLYHRLGRTPLSRIIDCGDTYAGNADTYDINMSVTTAVVPMGERTQLRTWVEALGRQQTSSSTLVNCMSKGLIEQSIYRMVNDSLAARPTQ
ncbi:MAG TPA: hypothetical protein VF771_03765 [Longimicrobiaceae bacterium]